MPVGFSILIPTSGRVQYLERLMQALEAAKARFDFPTETLLIDDTPMPERKLIEGLAERYSCRYISGPHSVAAKRNWGIQEAKHDYVLFLDSDCEPTPDILVEHWKSLTSSQNIAGCLGLLTFTGPEHWFWDVIELTPYVIPFNWPLFAQEVPWGPTANISYRRDVLLQIGGCDETFPPRPGGEDVDMGLRVTKAGFTIVTNSRAQVFHTKETWLDFYGALKRFSGWGRADYYLYVRHPDRVFLQFPRTIPVLLAFVLFSGAAALLFMSPWLVILPWLWFLLSLLLQAIIFQSRFGQQKNSDIAKRFVSNLLTLSDEAGFMWELSLRLDWKAMFFRLIYAQGQQIGEVEYGQARAWSFLLALLPLIVWILAWR